MLKPIVRCGWLLGTCETVPDNLAGWGETGMVEDHGIKPRPCTEDSRPRVTRELVPEQKRHQNGYYRIMGGIPGYESKRTRSRPLPGERFFTVERGLDCLFRAPRNFLAICFDAKVGGRCAPTFERYECSSFTTIEFDSTWTRGCRHGFVEPVYR